MALKEDLQAETYSIFRSTWTERDGAVVPEPEAIGLKNDGVHLVAACLYADMAESTHLANNETPQFAAEIYKAFLHCASKIIKNEGGTITSFDGDRVMGVFIGDTKNTNAVRAGLKINYAVTNIINPQMRRIYTNKNYEVSHSVGIDTSRIFAARTGVRGSNDIVWVGRAANYAAKLCSLRDGYYRTWITEDVHNVLMDEVKTINNQYIWEKRLWTPMNNYPIYRTN